MSAGDALNNDVEVDRPFALNEVVDHLPEMLAIICLVEPLPIRPVQVYGKERIHAEYDLFAGMPNT